MPQIVSTEEWAAAREQLLVKEKEHTRARDALAAERRRMPMVPVDKDYVFEGPDMEQYPEEGCTGCSMYADQVGELAHLNERDTTLVFVSRAPQEHIERFRKRMGWKVPWFTTKDDFGEDFGVGEWHGTNAFLRDGDQVFRTYFVNDRGDEALGSVWSYLDMTALGRQEEWEDSPAGVPQGPPYAWWRKHDAYES